MKWWLSDGCYDAATLESYLKMVFGPDKRMFHPNSEAAGTKVAVTATSISDASAFLFSNYNVDTHKKCGYKHVRPVNVDEEPCVWEA